MSNLVLKSINIGMNIKKDRQVDTRYYTMYRKCSYKHLMYISSRYL